MLPPTEGPPVPSIGMSSIVPSWIGAPSYETSPDTRRVGDLEHPASTSARKTVGQTRARLMIGFLLSEIAAKDLFAIDAADRLPGGLADAVADEADGAVRQGEVDTPGVQASSSNGDIGPAATTGAGTG